ncbi:MULTISPECIES: hypothetical protein [Alphaproteobacteria]|uniref:Uncharacterized protein n=1 Tax=Ciceribacter naphthalenivorans TaxID=1118451 RepID=A0A512HQE3_9HYPH|nr:MULTISPECIES: hypothetical protein [Alphaproteobacteria]GEO87656.1 hypothetical protein RNA01_45880 [Ciceribacter naphthalenivorans]
MREHCCGPEYAADYFYGIRQAAIAANTSNDYLVSCIDHEGEVLGVDFSKHYGVSSIVDGRLVTEFFDKSVAISNAELRPYKWLGSEPIVYLRSKDGSLQFGGPDVDSDFFELVGEVQEKHPSEAKTYAILSKNVFVSGLGMKGDDEVVEGTIRDGKVYQVLKRSDVFPMGVVCCTWDVETGECNGTWEGE